MRLLLTSAGIKNASIHDALVDLLGKPIADSNALCIPTAEYGHPRSVQARGHGVSSVDGSDNPMCELGWKSLGVLELTALPSIDEERWVPLVRETDVLLVAGGDALYLCHWMRESGLADLLPSLGEMVWVGLSAGSMVMTPRIGEDFVGWKPPTGGDETLGVVDFSICPHVNPEGMPGNSMAEAESWAAGIEGPAYAIDDETAIKVTDGTVEVVSEGHWRLFTPDSMSKRIGLRRLSRLLCGNVPDGSETFAAVTVVGQLSHELDPVLLGCLVDLRSVDRLEWRAPAWLRGQRDCTVELPVPWRRQDQIAGGFRLDAKSVRCPTGDVRERTRARPNPWLVADVQRDLTFEYVEGLHVLAVQVQRNAHSARCSLVDQRERAARALSCGKEVRGGLPHPAEFRLVGSVQIRVGRRFHGAPPRRRAAGSHPRRA